MVITKTTTTITTTTVMIFSYEKEKKISGTLNMEKMNEAYRQELCEKYTDIVASCDGCLQV